MTATPEPPRRKAARFLGRFSTGRDSSRHDIVSMSVRANQFVINDLRPFTQLGPTNSNHLCPPTSAIVAVGRAARNRPCGPSQIPIAPAAPPQSAQSRFPPLELFVRRPPESVATSSGAPVNIVRQVVWVHNRPSDDPDAADVRMTKAIVNIATLPCTITSPSARTAMRGRPDARRDALCEGSQGKQPRAPP